MAGVYVHIPFCRRRCNYCDFYFVTNDTLLERFLTALSVEIAERAHLLKQETISTIYFGGGTPSLLNGLQIERIIELIRNHFVLEHTLEVTLEANPEDITEEKLLQLKDAGINRLSLGIQAFEDKKLKVLSREHSAKESHESIEKSLKYFSNVSLDLIFGTEGESIDDWERELVSAIKNTPDHISAYSLTIEPFTPLSKMIARGTRRMPLESLQSEMFMLAMQVLDEAGFRHYEVSNYAKKNKESRHNSSYWKRIPYIGLGPSAHSYFYLNGQERRCANKSSLKTYIENPSDAIDFVETLSPIDQFNETVLLSLRQRDGLELELLKKSFNFAASHLKKLETQVNSFIQNELMVYQNGLFQLTNKGFTLADSIASDLFIS